MWFGRKPRVDLLQIVAYLKTHSPSGAAQVYAAIKAAMQTLNASVERGRVVPALQSQGVFQIVS